MKLIHFSRRTFLSTTCAAGFGLSASGSAQNLITANTATKQNATNVDGDAIRPFHVHIPDAALRGLRRRVTATNWPEREPVDDATQGVPLATMQKLAKYWAAHYDWRKVETKLNALPQLVTTIDGLDIHFILRSTRTPPSSHLLGADAYASEEPHSGNSGPPQRANNASGIPAKAALTNSCSAVPLADNGILGPRRADSSVCVGTGGGH